MTDALDPEAVRNAASDLLGMCSAEGYRDAVNVLIAGAPQLVDALAAAEAEKERLRADRDTMSRRVDEARDEMHVALARLAAVEAMLDRLGAVHPAKSVAFREGVDHAIRFVRAALASPAVPPAEPETPVCEHGETGAHLIGSEPTSGGYWFTCPGPAAVRPPETLAERLVRSYASPRSKEVTRTRSAALRRRGTAAVRPVEAPPLHTLTEYGTTKCPVEGVWAFAANGECSACGGPVEAPEKRP